MCVYVFVCVCVCVCVSIPPCACTPQHIWPWTFYFLCFLGPVGNQTRSSIYYVRSHQNISFNTTIFAAFSSALRTQCGGSAPWRSSATIRRKDLLARTLLGYIWLGLTGFLLLQCTIMRTCTCRTSLQTHIIASRFMQMTWMILYFSTCSFCLFKLPQLQSLDTLLLADETQVLISFSMSEYWPCYLFCFWRCTAFASFLIWGISSVLVA